MNTDRETISENNDFSAGLTRSGMSDLEARLRAAEDEAAFFRVQTEELMRVIQMAYDCFPDMPSVARQTLQPFAREL